VNRVITLNMSLTLDPLGNIRAPCDRERAEVGSVLGIFIAPGVR